MASVENTKKLKRTHTAVIFACLFAYGLVYAVIGGTRDDLKDIYHMTGDGVSQILVTRSAGLLVGSLLCGGFLYKHVNAKIAIILSLLAGGLGTAIVPDAAPRFWVAHVGQFVTGFSFGALEVGANVWLVQLWEERVDPMMQTYHVSYGIGALLAPLLTAPFLGPEHNETHNATITRRLEISALDSEPRVNGTSRIAVPYGIFGGAYSFMGLVIGFLFLIDRTKLRQHDAPQTDDAARQSTTRFEWTVVGLLSAFVVVEVTFESIMGNMLAVYVNRNPDLAMDKAEGNYLLSLYYAAFTSGRIASIFISLRLKPNTSIIVAQGINSIGAGVLLLLLFPATTGRTTVWLATGIIGLGLGPLYPTAFTWTVRYIHLKYAHMSTALIAACVGGFLPTYIVSPWVESSITVMPVVSAGCSVLLMSLIAAMMFTTHNRSPIYEKDDEENLVLDAKE